MATINKHFINPKILVSFGKYFLEHPCMLVRWYNENVKSTAIIVQELRVDQSVKTHFLFSQICQFFSVKTLFKLLWTLKKKWAKSVYLFSSDAITNEQHFIFICVDKYSKTGLNGYTVVFITDKKIGIPVYFKLSVMDPFYYEHGQKYFSLILW